MKKRFLKPVAARDFNALSQKFNEFSKKSDCLVLSVIKLEKNPFTDQFEALIFYETESENPLQ